jgi:MoaA/NifB/PqqE/SkfB family radical SAM enzyme
MLLKLGWRMMTEPGVRPLWKFLWNAGVGGMLSVERFKRRLRRGETFPPFLYLSITSRCNLRCQGCWVDVDAPPAQLDLATLDRVVSEAKRHGNRFFGLLGGEPFLHPGLLELLGRHTDCYFQVFTNGHPITDETAEALRRLGNATPLVSIEGTPAVSDARRGGAGVYDRTLGGLGRCVRAGLVTGVATSVCRNNVDDLVSEAWLRELIRLGVHYVWYYAYRPVGPRPAEDLALSPDQVHALRRFIVETRARLPIVIVDAYWDADGAALCPMAVGISHHIGPTGGIEPCPVIQLAAEFVDGGGDLYERTVRSAFLRDIRETAARAGRGCILLERPDLVRDVALRHDARDTTVRGTVLAELGRMASRGSQDLRGREVPETSVLYRFAKKHWFFGFGAYG